MQDYKVIPGQEFWEKFPYKDIPSKIEASVDTEKFEELLKENKEYMKDSERTRAETCIENLRTGLVLSKKLCYLRIFPKMPLQQPTVGLK